MCLGVGQKSQKSTHFRPSRAIAKPDPPIERQPEHRDRLRRSSCESSRETEWVEPSELVELGTTRRSRAPSQTELSDLGVRGHPNRVALNFLAIRRMARKSTKNPVLALVKPPTVSSNMPVFVQKNGRILVDFCSNRAKK